jgi:hypothetical protein
VDISGMILSAARRCVTGRASGADRDQAELVEPLDLTFPILSDPGLELRGISACP